MNFIEKMTKISRLFSGIIPGFPGPENLKRIAGVDVYESEYLLDELENNDIQIKQKETNVSFIEQQALSRCSRVEILKQMNINAVLENAKNSTNGDTPVDDEDVDIGWLMNFMEMASSISNKTMQMVWGKILAGKVKDTASISLHSLFTIARLSVKEAKLFSEISRYVVDLNGDNLILNDAEFNDKHSINYGDILRLDEYGLINSDGMVTITISWSDEAKLPVRYGNHVSWGFSDEKKKTTLQAFILREAGNDLLSVVDREIDEIYFKDFKDNILGKAKGAKFIDINVN